jgi:Fasciclin domain
LQQNAGYSAMVSAINRAGLSGLLNDASQNLTLFAADNAAFARLASRLGFAGTDAMINALTAQQWDGIVRYCLMPGRRLRSTLSDRDDTLWVYRETAMQLIFANENGQLTLWDGIGRFSIQLASADTAATNGVLHVTDDLLLPRGVLTVAQMLRASIDSYAVYAASMVATGVVDELSGPGPFTLCVPRDPGVPGGALNRDQVRHHVMTGPQLNGDDFQAEQTLTPLFGRPLVLRNLTPFPSLSYGTSVQAEVIDIDFWGSNGVIHTIDLAIPL